MMGTTYQSTIINEDTPLQEREVEGQASQEEIKAQIRQVEAVEMEMMMMMEMTKDQDFTHQTAGRINHKEHGFWKIRNLLLLNLH